MKTCRICHTENAKDASACSLCNTEFERQMPRASEREASGTSRASTLATAIWRRRTPLLFAALLACILVPLLSMRDLVATPSEVAATRVGFATLTASYEGKKAAWDEQKTQILLMLKRQRVATDLAKSDLSLDQIPFEVLLSYLNQHMDSLGADVAIYPSQQGTLILSKPENSLIMLSLEMRLSDKGQISFASLKRGQREISPTLAWTYFGAELSKLRALEMFQGGLKNLRIKANGALALDYQHQNMQPI